MVVRGPAAPQARERRTARRRHRSTGARNTRCGSTQGLMEPSGTPQHRLERGMRHRPDDFAGQAASVRRDHSVVRLLHLEAPWLVERFAGQVERRKVVCPQQALEHVQAEVVSGDSA